LTRIAVPRPLHSCDPDVQPIAGPACWRRRKACGFRGTPTCRGLVNRGHIDDRTAPRPRACAGRPPSAAGTARSVEFQGLPIALRSRSLSAGSAENRCRATLNRISGAPELFGDPWQELRQIRAGSSRSHPTASPPARPAARASRSLPPGTTDVAHPAPRRGRNARWATSRPHIPERARARRATPAA